ncbi:MAG: hypothetical protein RMJ59_03900, partial [Candidatus Nitrosocaldus sp.]|nr:hypothetical protein [Candidatus Nitrosocaldus sp.]
LDEKEWSELESLVLSNDGVKAVRQGKQYSLYSEGFVRYLGDDKPKDVEADKWYANNVVYIYHEGNEKYLLSALTDYMEKKVVDILVVKHPSQEFRSSHKY